MEQAVTLNKRELNKKLLKIALPISVQGVVSATLSMVDTFMVGMLGETEVDRSRLATEVAIFADRAAIDEEIVRLNTHLIHFRELLAAGEPVGRKMDFLVQEMNRECNTIGSKANDAELTSIVLLCKAEIEKLREQIQNIE